MGLYKIGPTCEKSHLFKMRHGAAYLLAALSGTTPTADAVNSILASVGVEADPEALKIVMKKFEGQDVESLIASGGALLAAMPAGGGGGGAVAAAGGAGDAPAAEEEKKKEEEPERNLMMTWASVFLIKIESIKK